MQMGYKTIHISRFRHHAISIKKVSASDFPFFINKQFDEHYLFKQYFTY